MVASDSKGGKETYQLLAEGLNLRAVMGVQGVDGAASWVLLAEWLCGFIACPCMVLLPSYASFLLAHVLFYWLPNTVVIALHNACVPLCWSMCEMCMRNCI